MLEKLVIKNIALIESAEINFKSGLNVLSGETGAGKSVILESLNFVLGAKADKTLIRSGSNECFVRAEFDVCDNDNVTKLLDEFDIDNDDVLTISRKFNLDGKSSIKVNGVTVTAAMLKRLTALLVDVHGQSEHFHLLKATNQLNLIDRFGGEKIDKVKVELSQDYAKYRQIQNQLNELGGDESQRLIRLDVLNYQINEIEKSDLKENEENELIDIKNKLSHLEKIVTALNAVKSAITDEGGVSDVLSSANKILSSITGLGEVYSNLYERLYAVYSELDDISDCAGSLLDDFDFSEYNPDEIEDRLEQIKSLKKKYGGDIESVFSYLESAKEEKEKLENFNETTELLQKEKESLQKVLYNNYIVLSNLRRECSKIFAKNVLDELKELGMSKARFEVDFADTLTIDQCKFDSANGIDQLEFKFSANLGEPLKPLSLVISGGEMSRFMLSIKAQTAKYNDISTFIFDEIDAGISGVIAKVVAEKFARISKSVQIIAITHLPQISSMADNNLLIEKIETGDKTVTTVKNLNENEKVAEITRLIGGSVDSQSAVVHAKELIEKAKEFKNSLNN